MNDSKPTRGATWSATTLPLLNSHQEGTPTTMLLIDTSIVLANGVPAGGTAFDGVSAKLLAILFVLAGLVIAFVGFKVAARGDKGNVKQAANSGGVVVIGTSIMVVGALFALFAGFLSGFFSDILG